MLIRNITRYQALVAQVEEPSSFQEVVQHQVWVDAMIEQYASIMTNDVWEVIPRPQSRSVLDHVGSTRSNTLKMAV